MYDFRLSFFEGSNRIVLTKTGRYNPKNRKQNQVIADIRDAQQIKILYECLEIIYDPEPDVTGWMSPISYTITSMKDKEVIDSVGVVLVAWLRKAEWKSDFLLTKHEEYKEWLLKNSIVVPSF